MKRVACFLMTLSVLCLAAACAGPNRVAEDFGTSFHLSKMNQMLNPEAGEDLEPVSGMDGKAAQTAVESYRKGFERQEETPQYIVNVGGKGQ